MANAGAVVSVEGLAELQAAFRSIDKGLARDMNKTLKAAAEPVRVEAQSLALTRIRNMPKSPEWAVPRIGVTGKAVVYMVPRKRGRGNGRTNLKDLMLARSYMAALYAKQGEVVQEMEDMVDNLADRAGF